MTIAYQNHPARLAAFAAGANLFVGPPCVRCDAVSPRYVSSGDCQACYLERRANDPALIKLRKKRAKAMAAKIAAKATKIAEREAARPAKSASPKPVKSAEPCEEIAPDTRLIRINSEYLRRLTLEKLAAIRQTAMVD
jgi:hypothetical protein